MKIRDDSNIQQKLRNRRTLYQKLKELFTYGIGGVLTTLVNYLIYFGLGFLRVDYLWANTLAWAGAVLFAFFINRKWVFASGGNWKKEFIAFTGMRFITLGVENLLLYLLVEQLSVPSGVSKILVSVVTVLANYVICQKHIFIKSEKRETTDNSSKLQEGE